MVIELGGIKQREYSGSERYTTNNRMEMIAVIEAIERTTGRLIVRTDSQLVLLCAVGRWKRKKNIDLWERYAKAASGRDILFEWWRGHSGTPGNERADKLACDARMATYTTSHSASTDLVSPVRRTGLFYSEEDNQWGSMMSYRVIATGEQK